MYFLVYPIYAYIFLFIMQLCLDVTSKREIYYFGFHQKLTIIIRYNTYVVNAISLYITRWQAAIISRISYIRNDAINMIMYNVF